MYMFAGPREGRTGTKPLPNVTAEQLADQLASTDIGSNMSFTQRLALAQEQLRQPALYTHRSVA